jgi:hypothetical protein
MFIESMDEFLSQTGQYCTMGRTAFGVSTITTITTTKCFAYQGTFQEIKSGTQFTRPFDYFILLPSTISTVICEGDVIKSVIDSSGNTVVACGKLEKFDKYSHWNHGLQCYIGGLTVVSS